MSENSNYQKFKILVADDHKLFRDGLAATLKLIKSVVYVAQAVDGNEVLSILEKRDMLINIIFMDINMPGKDGISTTREVKSNYPNVKIIALSMYDDRKHVLEMMEAGASGYLLKNTNKTEIANAMETVWNGDHFFGKDVSRVIVGDLLEHLGADTGLQPLLMKEIEILKLISKGRTSKEIAYQLNLSHRTVEGYRASLLEKTKEQNLAGLIKFAIRNGYGEDD